MDFLFYEVGGKVRDELLGVPSKDVDFVAVPSEQLLSNVTETEEMFKILSKYLVDSGYDIKVETPDCYTIRALFPKGHKYKGVADVVLARKECGYVAGTRRPIVKPGSLYDDLLRRDFTLNAMAKDDDGTIIDFFNGKEALDRKMLITPLDAKITFDDDPLRILRAIRFHITKGFRMSFDIRCEIYDYDYDAKMSVVSGERIREELYKCFRFDTLKTLNVLNDFKNLRDYIFAGDDFWLKPTFENK